MDRKRIKKETNSINLNLSFISVICIIFFILIASIYTFKTDKNQLNANLSKEKNVKETSDETLNKVKNFITKNNLNRDIDIVNDEQGIKLRIKESLLFESSKADLAYDSKGLLDKITILINSLNNNIIIEGHTDNIPVSNYKFESNWDLSSTRAVSIVKYFTEVKKIDKKRFTASGFGDSRPIVDNDTNENRAKNRRIDILILVK